MKSFSEPALAAIAAGTAIYVGAIEILCDPPVRVWGGHHTIDIDGWPYLPAADRGMVNVTGGALGSAATNVDLTLSGIDPETLALLDADDVRRAPATLYRLIFAGDGSALLDIEIYQRGRLDQISSIETVGGTATVKAMLETAARGLGRRGGRMRSDADQRLVKADDGFFKHVSYAAEKQLYWGGKRPATAGSALTIPGWGGHMQDVVNRN